MKKIIGLLGLWALDVHAAEVTEAFNKSALSQGLMLAVFGMFAYLMIIRPQSKRAKEHQNLITRLQKEDEVITTGGLLGTITGVNEAFFLVRMSDGVEMWVQKQAIVSSIPKGTLKNMSR